MNEHHHHVNGSSSREADRLESEIQSIRTHVTELAEEASRRFQEFGKQRSNVAKAIKIGAGALAGLFLLRLLFHSRHRNCHKIIVIGDELLWKELSAGKRRTVGLE